MKLRWIGSALASFLTALVVSSPAMAGPEVGESAPDWTLPGSDGATYTLSELRGQHVVISFFPKAYTAG